MTVPIITHTKLEERRGLLKAENLEKFFAFKARRYAMFRMQTFLDGGASPEAEHFEIAKELEADSESLGGAKSFAIEWDLDPLTGKVIRRDKSVWKVHEEFMARAAVQLVEDKDGNVSSSIAPKKKHKRRAKKDGR